MTRLDVNVARCEALFTSGLQPRRIRWPRLAHGRHPWRSRHIVDEVPQAGQGAADLVLVAAAARYLHKDVKLHRHDSGHHTARTATYQRPDAARYIPPLMARTSLHPSSIIDSRASRKIFSIG